MKAALFLFAGCAGKGCYQIAKQHFEQGMYPVPRFNLSALAWCLPPR